ncbi:hypothetical protein AXG93_2912s1410 [Marchantia polymorpha subsp. ruderalis]|uniref:Uncharacterized protein n=1 Tax=Marchantia polymorpha subsp. ruderalis TaxID=1480154 RepID=A0A176WHU4_MARPO|nr:hypothetical protein AXG93_2912s1410 [Marchantia polymorpha subsp. ruderalis]
MYVLQKTLTKMAKNGAFNKMYLIVALVLLGLSSMAAAVDVAFFSNTVACSGLGTIRTGASSRVCYYGNAGSIRFTGLVFTEDSAKGTWILKSSNATQLMSQIENLTDEEKLSWFKAHGASFEDTPDTQNEPLN